MHNREKFNPAATPTELPRGRILRAVDHDYEHPEDLDTQSAEHLEEFREQLLQLPEFISYKNQRITLHTFDDIIETVQVKKPESPGRKKIIDTLTQLRDSINDAVASYYRSIIREELLKNQAFRMEPEQYKDEMEARERHRRATHNGLITDLTVFTRYLNISVPKQAKVKIPKKMLFDQHELADRTMIGEWAYNSELGRRIEEIVTHIDLLLQKETEA